MQLHVLQDKVASAQAKSDKMAAAVSSWGGSMLRRAFTTWKDRHASWQQGHAKAARAAALWQNRALASAWQQWKESAIYQQELRLRLTGAVGQQQCSLCVLAAQTASADVARMHCNLCMHATYLAPRQDRCSAQAFSQVFACFDIAFCKSSCSCITHLCPLSKAQSYQIRSKLSLMCAPKPFQNLYLAVQLA